MNLLVYILVYPIIWFISILPFRVLYFISDIIYFIVYYIFDYRKKVILDNLKLVFPEKSNKELIEISKKSFHHFIDIFIEMIKSFTISKKEIEKRYRYKNIELINNLYSDKKSIILTGAHYANWEWILSITSFIKHKGYAAYTKVNNSYFDNAILKSRGRFGVTLKQTSNIIAEINYNYKNNIPSIYGLLSDQSPLLKKTFYWKRIFWN